MKNKKQIKIYGEKKSFLCLSCKNDRVGHFLLSSSCNEEERAGVIVRMRMDWMDEKMSDPFLAICNVGFSDDKTTVTRFA